MFQFSTKSPLSEIFFHVWVVCVQLISRILTHVNKKYAKTRLSSKYTISVSFFIFLRYDGVVEIGYRALTANGFTLIVFNFNHFK